MIPSRANPVTSRRVLIVEGGIADRQALRNWLAAERIETSEACDIVTALAACQRYQPHLILLQLRLPTWDGLEVIKRFKDDHKTRTIPVIFLADNASTVEKARGIDRGAVDFLCKPFDPVEVMARVNAALRTKMLLDLLDQRAHLDGLTELGNRFALQDELPLLVSECREKALPLSMMVADLDLFKRVNDTYGHAAGDEVLRRMADVLRGSVRPDDFLARYGGEEFVVACPGCPLVSAAATAERLRESLAAQVIQFRAAQIRATVSVGVAHADPAAPALAADELLERADQALYRAKGAGRNCVWWWDPNFQKPLPATPDPAAAAVAAAPASRGTTLTRPPWAPRGPSVVVPRTRPTGG